jgi:hypothetical protein
MTAHPKGTYGQLQDDLKASEFDLPNRLRLLADFHDAMQPQIAVEMRKAADEIDALEERLIEAEQNSREIA